MSNIENQVAECPETSRGSAAKSCLGRRTRLTLAINSHAIAFPWRASLAHFDAFTGFCSSQKWPFASVKLRRLVCPSRSVQVVMSANVGARFGIVQFYSLAFDVLNLPNHEDPPPTRSRAHRSPHANRLAIAMPVPQPQPAEIAEPIISLAGGGATAEFPAPERSPDRFQGSRKCFEYQSRRYRYQRAEVPRSNVICSTVIGHSHFIGFVGLPNERGSPQLTPQPLESSTKAAGSQFPTFVWGAEKSHSPGARYGWIAKRGAKEAHVFTRVYDELPVRRPHRV
jgi:hypothetical protein